MSAGRIENRYTASRGSVIIELKPTFLETLSVGEHTIQAEFTDGKADAKFTIQASAVVSLPQTGDKNNVLIYALIGVIALAGLETMMKKRI